LGPHPLLLAAADRRMREAGVWPGDPRTAVVLAAAGSSASDATASVHGVARHWARTGWWGVRAAFASASGPTVAEVVEGLRRRGAPRVVVASYLLAPGRLPDRVRDQAYEAGAALVTEPLGAADEVARLVLARYAEGSAALGHLVSGAA
ncbi:MAG: sirohydrochlorin chelatase, partial [Actinomycetes bacterium]